MEASGIWFEALVVILGSLAVAITISAAALVIDYRSGRLGVPSSKPQPPRLEGGR